MKRLKISLLGIYSTLPHTPPDSKTDDGRYLVINHHLGDLIIRVSSTDRKTVLQNGREAYERYLSLLDHYEILSTADKKLYQAYVESPTTFSTISTMDPSVRRGAKIANFKAEKDLKKKLEVFRGYRTAEPSLTRSLVSSTKSCVSPK
jgi:immunoglobulin-binding protein 1